MMWLKSFVKYARGIRMRTKKEYKIIYGEKTHVQDTVNMMMKNGWVCQGGMAISRIGESMQAMIYIKRWWQFWR